MWALCPPVSTDRSPSSSLGTYSHLSRTDSKPAGSPAATPLLQHHLLRNTNSVRSDENLSFVCEQSRRKIKHLKKCCCIWNNNSKKNGEILNFWSEVPLNVTQNQLDFLETRLCGQADWKLPEQMVILTEGGNSSCVCCSSLMIYCGKPHKPQRHVATQRQPQCRHKGLLWRSLYAGPLDCFCSNLSGGHSSEEDEGTTASSKRQQKASEKAKELDLFFKTKQIICPSTMDLKFTLGYHRWSPR